MMMGWYQKREASVEKTVVDGDDGGSGWISENELPYAKNGHSRQ